MEFEIRKRRRLNVLPFVIAAGILLLAVGLYVWKYGLSDHGISTDAEKSLTEGITAPETEEIIYAGSHRVTADLPEKLNQAAAGGQTEKNQAEDKQPGNEQVENGLVPNEQTGNLSAGQEDHQVAFDGRKNNPGIVTIENSRSMNSFLQEIPEFSVINEEPNYALFLISEEGYITAYLGDQTDVFEYTQIPITSFPEVQQEMLEQGLYMETFADYYDFLESYTS